MSLCQSATIPTVRIVLVLIFVIECYTQIQHKTPLTLRELHGIDLDFLGISMHDMVWEEQFGTTVPSRLALETALNGI